MIHGSLDVLLIIFAVAAASASPPALLPSPFASRPARHRRLARSAQRPRGFNVTTTPTPTAPSLCHPPTPYRGSVPTPSDASILGLYAFLTLLDIGMYDDPAFTREEVSVAAFCLLLRSS